MKFIHAADLHLDSALSGLERYEGAPVEAIRGATRRALENLVQLAITEQVAFLLIAGDVYDGDWPDYNTGLFFVQQMSRLREARIAVLIVSGNHDAQSKITKSLRLPDNVTLFPAANPQSVSLEKHGVVVHGQSFASQSVKDDLSAGYPDATRAVFNIGLLHTSLNGRPGHEPYAPCSLNGLLGKGYDYWALGHVHQREIVNEDPWVVYPGNTQGRHARETGPKGCAVVTVLDGAVESVEYRDLDVVRWKVLDIDASGADRPSTIVDLVADSVDDGVGTLGDQLLVARIHIHGACQAHSELVVAPDHWRNQIRARVTDRSGERAWVEKIKLETQAETDLTTLADRDDALGGLLRGITGLEADTSFMKDMVDLFADISAKIPAELRVGDEPLKLDDPAFLSEALDDVKELLVATLLAKGSEQ